MNPGQQLLTPRQWQINTSKTGDVFLKVFCLFVKSGLQHAWLLNQYWLRNKGSLLPQTSLWLGVVDSRTPVGFRQRRRHVFRETRIHLTRLILVCKYPVTCVTPHQAISGSGCP